MAVSLRQEVNSLLEALTHSGSSSLDPQLIKKLRKICSSSHTTVRITYEFLLNYLSKNHAEVRLSSFQIVQELFPRSHLFRELLILDFHKIASLVAGTDPHLPLPLPKVAAAQLKKKSLLAIREWNDKFGDGYPKLRLGYNYLKVVKKVDFDELVFQTEAVRRRQEEREGRRRTLLHQKIQEVKQEMKDMTRDIEDCMLQISSCFNLLLPRFDAPDIYSSDGLVSSSEKTSLSSNQLHKDDSPTLAVPCDTNVPMTTNNDDEYTECVEGGGDQRSGDPRQRTVSSSSFVSLSSDGASDTSVRASQSDDDIRSSENRPGTFCNEEFSVTVESHSSLTETSREKDRVAGGADSDFLRKLYGVTSSSAQTPVSRGIKRGGGKGKSPLKLTRTDSPEHSGMRKSVKFDKFMRSANSSTAATLSEGCEIGEVTGDGLPGVTEDCVSEPTSGDSDSEVEWEDVEVAPPTSHSHSLMSVHDSEMDLQAHGITTHGFTIPVELNTIPILHENHDNASILATLRDSKQLLVERYLTAINRWMEWMSKAPGEDDTLRNAISMKHRVRNSLDKFDRLKIIYKTNREGLSAESSSGETEGAAVSKPQVTHPPEWTIHSQSHASMFDADLDPTTPQAQIAKLQKKVGLESSKVISAINQSTSVVTSNSKSDLISKAPIIPSTSVVTSNSKSDLISKAPIIPFGMDLYYWGNPCELEPITKAPLGSLHRFWVEEREVDLSSDEQARLKCRTIPYPGRFEPVHKTCRSPLPSGKLCPRRDRFKCPFHGLVIPRDERGLPVSKPAVSSSTPDTSQSGQVGVPSSTPNNSQSGQVASSPASNGQWPLDIELQDAIRDAAGAELLQTKKKRKDKPPPVKKHPGLTDLKVHTDTPRTRLEKKVLNKQALKRVATSVNSLNAKKYKDKFGNNFNYALSN